MRVIESDPTLTTREVTSKLRRTHGAIHYQFKELRLVSKLGVWLSDDLSRDPKKKRVDSSQKLLSLHSTDNWLRNLTTGDEKWGSLY